MYVCKIPTLVGTSECLSKGVNDVKFKQHKINPKESHVNEAF